MTSHRSTPKMSHRQGVAATVTLLVLSILFESTGAVLSKSVVQESYVLNKCWEQKITPDLDVSPVTDSSTVYFLDSENKLQAFELSAGTKVWSSELGGEVVSNLLAAGDSLFVVTSSQGGPVAAGTGTLRSVSRKTGITEWRTEVSGSPIVWIGMVADNVVAVGSEGGITALSPVNGHQRWKADLSAAVVSWPDFGAGDIALGTSGNDVVRISGSDGSTHIEWRSEYLPTAILHDADGRLVVGDERGNVALVSSRGDRLWRFKNGARISSALMNGSEYLAASNDNFVYKLSRYGDVKWKRRLPGRVVDRPLILGNAAVISIVGEGSVYVLDLKSGKVLNRIELGKEISLRLASDAKGRGLVIGSADGIHYFSSETCEAK